METIRERLLKVLRLAEQGVGGERENAAALLEKLLRKHNMTMADLEAVADQPRATVWLNAADVDERAVLSQLALKLFGTDRKMWQRSGSAEMGIDVTPSEHAAMTIAWEVYQAAWREARQSLVIAFCYKHNLFAAEGASATAMSAEEQARAARALAIADNLPVVDPPTRRLGASSD